MTKDKFMANMAGGPRLYAFWDGHHYYGDYHLLKFGEEERGKTLTITVDSNNLPLCWIELWPATYDGQDTARWAAQRGSAPLLSTGHSPHPNPSLTWIIVPGEYTIYFVNSSRSSQVYDRSFSFEVEII